MWLNRLNISLLACLLGSMGAVAQDSAAEPGPEEVITAALSQIVDPSQLGPVRPSVIEGLYSVQIVGGPTLMVTPDGKYAVVGDTLEITPDGLTQVQDPYLVEARKEFLAGLGEHETINFSPDGETKTCSLCVYRCRLRLLPPPAQPDARVS